MIWTNGRTINRYYLPLICLNSKKQAFDYSLLFSPIELKGVYSKKMIFRLADDAIFSFVCFLLCRKAWKPARVGSTVILKSKIRKPAPTSWRTNEILTSYLPSMVTIFVSLLPFLKTSRHAEIIPVLVGIGIESWTNGSIHSMPIHIIMNALCWHFKGKKLITFFPIFSFFLFWCSLTKTSVSEPDGIDNSYQPAGWSNGSYVSELFENKYIFVPANQKKQWNQFN